MARIKPISSQPTGQEGFPPTQTTASPTSAGGRVMNLNIYSDSQNAGVTQNAPAVSLQDLYLIKISREINWLVAVQIPHHRQIPQLPVVGFTPIRGLETVGAAEVEAGAVGFGDVDAGAAEAALAAAAQVVFDEGLGEAAAAVVGVQAQASDDEIVVFEGGKELAQVLHAFAQHRVAALAELSGEVEEVGLAGAA